MIRTHSDQNRDRKIADTWAKYRAIISIMMPIDPTTTHRITLELIPDPEYGGFTARIPDLPAYGEGQTEEEAIADLREAIRGYIEAYGVEDALSRINTSLEIRQVDWDLAELARG